MIHTITHAAHVFLILNMSTCSPCSVVNSYRLCKHSPMSSLTDALESDSWRVSAAPLPKDILWYVSLSTVA